MQAITDRRPRIRIVRVVRAGTDHQNETQRIPRAEVERHRLAARCRECLPTIQVSASGWRFDDTKRKRSRRIVKLQEFVRKALEGGCEPRNGRQTSVSGRWSTT